MLAAAWLAAPHVLDWATHTWYTVVKDRDLEAESGIPRGGLVRGSGFGGRVQEAASSAASEPEQPKDVLDGKAIVSGGGWAAAGHGGPCTTMAALRASGAAAEGAGRGLRPC